MNTRVVVFEENDGSIPHCLFSVDGVGFDAYYIYDAVGLDWGDRAELMRKCLKPDAKRFEVKFPNGDRRRYVTVESAKRAVRNHLRR